MPKSENWKRLASSVSDTSGFHLHPLSRLSTTFMPEAEWRVCSLYAFRIRGEVIRIGKDGRSPAPADLSLAKGSTSALKGRFHRGGTTRDQAKELGKPSSPQPTRRFPGHAHLVPER